MMRSVPGRVSSPAFIGRRAALDALLAAVAGLDHDRRRVVLVHGEAGIGKTRLLDEFARSVQGREAEVRPALVFRGGCLDLGDGDLPYAPILDVLDALASVAVPADEASAIRSLRDELGGAGDSERVSSGRGRTFVAIRDHLVTAARDADVIVWVDDLHWADRSTLELLTFVSTRVAPARVLFVMSYRSDELARGHPLRNVVAEFERGGVVADIALEPLGQADIRDQLDAILGEAPDARRLDRIVALADGNPFHVEELAALDVEAGALPRSLRAVLLARLDRLDDATVDLLGRAAVIGRDVDEGLLLAVTPMPERQVRAALRQATASNVLEPTPDGRRTRFRHALLREAVLAELQPGERMALHRAVAEALEARRELGASTPAVAAAELAYHWSEAGDDGRAFPALMEAGRRAQSAYAWTEASEAFERAAGLAAARTGGLAPIELAELWMRAAWLVEFAGDVRHGYDLATTAIRADDGSDPRRSGALLNWLATLASDAGEFEAAEQTSEQALALIPAAPPSSERADAISSLAGRRMIANRCREAIDLADQAIAIYREIGADARLATALACRAVSAASLGRVEEARVALDESMALYDTIGDEGLWQAAEIVTNGAFTLYLIDDFEAVAPFVDAAMARAAEIGVERGWSVWLNSTAATTALATGDWNAAAQRLAMFGSDADAGIPHMDALAIEAELAAGRGDRARTEELLAGAYDAASRDWFSGQLARVRAVAALWDHDPQVAAHLAEEVLRIMAGHEELPSLAEILKSASRAYADLAGLERAGRRHEEGNAAARRAVELASDAAALGSGTYLDGGSSSTRMRANAAQVVAEAARAEGRADPVAWDAAAVAHEGVGTLPDAAYCRYRQAEALLEIGDRGAATAALVDARLVAARVGILPLVHDIEDLARRARLSIDAGVADADAVVPAQADPWGLTVREREVLDLVATGRTNREIGAALFISDKTASVHVTHILDKLGVSSRTEAALLVGRTTYDRRPAADP